MPGYAQNAGFCIIYPRASGNLEQTPGMSWLFLFPHFGLASLVVYLLSIIYFKIMYFQRFYAKFLFISVKNIAVPFCSI